MDVPVFGIGRSRRNHRMRESIVLKQRLERFGAHIQVWLDRCGADSESAAERGSAGLDVAHGLEIRPSFLPGRGADRRTVARELR